MNDVIILADGYCPPITNVGRGHLTYHSNTGEVIDEPDDCCRIGVLVSLSCDRGFRKVGGIILCDIMLHGALLQFHIVREVMNCLFYLFIKKI